MIRRFAIGLSLANLLFLDVWRNLFDAHLPGAAFLTVRRYDYLALCAVVLALGLAFAFVGDVAWRSRPAWLREATMLLFIATAFFPLNAVRRMYDLGIPRVLVRLQHGAPLIKAALLGIAL